MIGSRLAEGGDRTRRARKETGNRKKKRGFVHYGALKEPQRAGRFRRGVGRGKALVPVCGL